MGGKSCIFAAKYALKNTSPPTSCPKIDPLSVPEDQQNLRFLFVFLKKKEKVGGSPNPPPLGMIIGGGPAI
jgi:hypothetical protein